MSNGQTYSSLPEQPESFTETSMVDSKSGVVQGDAEKLALLSLDLESSPTDAKAPATNSPRTQPADNHSLHPLAQISHLVSAILAAYGFYIIVQERFAGQRCNNTTAMFFRAYLYNWMANYVCVGMDYSVREHDVLRHFITLPTVMVKATAMTIFVFHCKAGA